MAVEKLGIYTLAEIARAMGESDGVVGNWARRGISKAGALKAQGLWGCSATWLLHERGDMWSSAQENDAAAAAVSDLGDAIANLSPMAMELALFFDDVLPPADRIKRSIAYSEACSAILRNSAVRDAPPSGVQAAAQSLEKEV